MKQKLKHIVSDFFQKLRYKFRISVINEDTLQETWHTRLSRFNVMLLSIAFLLFTFLLLTVIIFTTPLKHYLPGYKDSGNRVAFVRQSMLVDSLQKRVEMQENYLTSMRNIITDNTKTDSIKKLDTAIIKQHSEKLLKKSKEEEEFVKNYENTEKFNLSAIPPKESERIKVFFRPVSGVIASIFNPKENEFGISIITSPNETVKSVLEGDIIFAEYTFSNRWVIQVQHPDNYISIYKNNSKILRTVGDKVKAGESIAITGDKEESSKTEYFYFELWKNGSPINPKDVITFRF